MITILSGCMGSGKTEALIKKYNELKQQLELIYNSNLFTN
jgi:thymidine kinase